MTKIELLGLSKKDIMKMCKEAGLPRYKGKSELTKEEMIDSLLANVEFVDESCQDPDVIVVKGEAKEQPVVVEEKEEVVPWVMKDRSNLIEQADVGTLIAFYDEKGKPRTAALVNRSSKNKVVKLVTEFEREFIVPYDNVIWIKKGNRWPRGVYNLLKGYKADANKTENK